MNIKHLLLLFLPLTSFLSCAGLPETVYEEDLIEPLAFYSVENGKILPDSCEEEESLVLTEENRNLHLLIWNRSLEIIPDSYEHFIKNFRISSDGVENIMAFVEPAEEGDKTNLSSWTLAIDLVDVLNRMGEVKNRDMDETLIHEFGHILSLNSEEVNALVVDDPDDMSWMEEWDFSTTYRMNDCVAREKSYLNMFFQQFWGEEQIREWFAIYNDSETEDDYYSALNSLSIKYYTDFVSDYAMTNPEEDFAESFTHFVMKEKPVGDTISHQKIRFFYDFPELLAIRDEIRSVLPESYAA